MSRDGTVTIQLSRAALKGARLGFFEHEGLGKFVRVSDINESGKNRLRLEVVSEDYLTSTRVSSNGNHLRWPQDPKNFENVKMLVESAQNYDPLKNYQSLEVRA